MKEALRLLLSNQLIIMKTLQKWVELWDDRGTIDEDDLIDCAQRGRQVVTPKGLGVT